MVKSFERPFVARLQTRLAEPTPLIQVLVGPRQVGKTTGVRQLLARRQGAWHYANADDLLTADRSWFLAQWQTACGWAKVPCSSLSRRVPGDFDPGQFCFDVRGANEIPYRVLSLG